MRNRNIGLRIEDRADEPEDIDIKDLLKHEPPDAARRDAGGRLAGAGAFERFPAIGRQPFDRPRKIRVTRSRAVHRRRRLQIIKTRVPVFDEHRDRRPDGFPEPDPGEDLDRMIDASHLMDEEDEGLPEGLEGPAADSEAQEEPAEAPQS